METIQGPPEVACTVVAHVVVVRWWLGCGASSRQAVIGWSMHK